MAVLLTSAFVILWLAIVYLALLGIAAIVRPAAARHFLEGFAQTPRANLVEAMVRFAIGVSFAVAAPFLPFPLGFRVIGAFLALTALLMLVLPRQHRRLAAHSVAMVAPYVRLIGAASLVLAGLLATILWVGVETTT